jgi:glycosyltransferase involved in cell wall biosynthesis
VYCPELQSAQNCEALDRGVQLALQQQSHFITDASSTKQQLMEQYGVSEDRIEVIPLACKNDRFQPVIDPVERAKVRAKYALPAGPYLLTVGTIEPRKNLLNSIRAFNRLTAECPHLDIGLVIAGGHGWGTTSALMEEARRSRRIQFLGFVDDADLPAVYSGAVAMTYVSFHEGFGLPLLEAMSCGVPVVYGNNSSMPEVVADAGLPADPASVEDIKEQYRRILTNPDLRRALARRAVLRSLRFDWRLTAERTLEVYERCLQGAAPLPVPSPFRKLRRSEVGVPVLRAG